MKTLKVYTSAIWEEIIVNLEDKMGEIKVKTWIKNIVDVSFNTSTCTLTAPSPFHKCVLETKFSHMIEDTIYTVTGSKFKLNIIAKPNDPIPFENTAVDCKFIDRLNPIYTFENFVSGSCNKKALDAAYKISVSKTCNPCPLLVLGGTGTGKTHLLHAIGNHYKKHNRSAKIVYLSIDDYINELIRKIKNDNPDSIERSFEKLDLLLIDDLHLIERKSFTQSEFFRMLTRLKSRNVRLVLAITKPIGEAIEKYCPNLIKPSNEVKIHRPDFHTKKKILKKYAEADGVLLSNETVELIAKAKYQGVRELKGAFNKAKLQALESQASCSFSNIDSIRLYAQAFLPNH